MKKPDITEALFILLAVLALTAVPYLILTWEPQGEGRVINVAGYNLADPDPGVWIVSEGRMRFSKEGSNEIRVKKGELITLHLTSMDVVHVFKLSEYNISEALAPGEIRAVEFVADKSGEYEFYCNARSCGPGHLEMRGMLIVE